MTIVTKLSGGLGNQLFQYAAARGLGLRLDRPIKADLNWFHDLPEGSTPRIPLLSHFRLPLDYVDSKGHPESLAPPAVNLWHAVTRPARILKEKQHFHFDARIAALAKRSRVAYLDGYWQSFRYFEDARAELLQDLTSPAAPDAIYAGVAEHVSHTQAVMVHVRRGDYVHSQSAAHVHGALSLDYYQRALERVRGQVAHPHLFFFSDDIDWVRANLRTDLPSTYVASAPGATAVIDELMLMRKCRHHVIANSSLSWWGAWLSESPQKTVIAPRGWLNARMLGLEDLIPPGWHVLES